MTGKFRALLLARKQMSNCKCILVLLAASVINLLSANTAYSETVFEQPVLADPPGLISSLSRQRQGFDDFTLAEDSVIADVHWYGTCSTIPFSVSFWDNAPHSCCSGFNDRPGTKIFETTATLVPMSVEESSKCKFQLDSFGPLSLLGGTKYWLSVVSTGNNFAWAAANRDPVSVSLNTATGQYGLVQLNVAFSLATADVLDIDEDGVTDSIDNCPATANPSQSDIDLDGAGDLCDVCPAVFPNECDTDGSAAEEATTDEGGILVTPDGQLELEIDPGDLAEDTTISITETVGTDPEVDLSIGANPGLGQALAFYDLEPDGLQFLSDITLNIVVDVTDLNDSQRANLGVYRFEDTDMDGIQDTFVSLPTMCNVIQDPMGTFIATCTVQVDHFSSFAIVVPLDTDGDGVPDDFNGVMDLCPVTISGDAVDEAGCSDAQVDGDGDGICTADALSSGPSNCIGSDNCPIVSNPGQDNFDGDDFGDVCDDDDDNDGVLDVADLCPATPIPLGTISYLSCDSGVADFLIPNAPGCSVSQQIERLATGVKNRGQLASRVDKLLKNLQKQGLLQPQEKDPIKTCVAQN